MNYNDLKKEDFELVVGKLSKQVINYLNDNKILLTPYNYNLYFEKLAEDLNEESKNKIQYLLNLQSQTEEKDTNIMENEKHIKNGVSSIQNILSSTANIYKLSNSMDKILQKNKEHLANNPEKKEKIIENIILNIETANKILDKEINQIKTVYHKTFEIIKTIKDNTIYDEKYETFNSKYFLMKIDQEKNINNLELNSTILGIKLVDSILNNKEEKMKFIFQKNIAKLLMKTSRRNDIITHYKNGVFFVLLKQTNLNNSILAAKRLHDLIEKTIFFIGDDDINLKVNIILHEINKNINSESIENLFNIIIEDKNFNLERTIII